MLFDLSNFILRHYFKRESASKHAKHILRAISNVDRPAKVNLTLHEPWQIDYYIVILIPLERLQFIHVYTDDFIVILYSRR